jgi:hypothetical protein
MLSRRVAKLFAMPEPRLRLAMHPATGLLRLDHRRHVIRIPIDSLSVSSCLSHRLKPKALPPVARCRPPVKPDVPSLKCFSVSIHQKALHIQGNHHLSRVGTKQAWNVITRIGRRTTGDGHKKKPFNGMKQK